ncbi:Non-classical phosphatidylinositol transfer protein (PITP) [Oleoguttula sp. CCFEE 5521]
MADWNHLPKHHVLYQFALQVDQITAEADHNEMYGIMLQPTKEGDKPSHTTLIILQKFLRANAGDLPKAKTQLLEALNWRKQYRPLEAKDEVFSKAKFGGLGYVTRLKGVVDTANEEDVATFNIYGAAAKDPKKTFGDVDAFIRWRIALMELTLSALALNTATLPIPDYGAGPDPYQAIQIHDYLSVSFFRQPAEVKASSSRIIALFSKYYPETVSYKYFVNVPIVMQWMMGTMKMLLSSDAVKKMTWMTYGSELVQYLGQGIGKEYGGQGPSLSEMGETVTYDDDVEAKKA